MVIFDEDHILLAIHLFHSPVLSWVNAVLSWQFVGVHFDYGIITSFMLNLASDRFFAELHCVPKGQMLGCRGSDMRTIC